MTDIGNNDDKEVVSKFGSFSDHSRKLFPLDLPQRPLWDYYEVFPSNLYNYYCMMTYIRVFIGRL